MNLLRDQRLYPRVPVGTLATEISGSTERPSIIIDVSDTGLRLQRSVGDRPLGRIVQLEFELPEVDEIIWAKGLVCFDQYWSLPAGPAAPERSLLVHLSGVRVLAAAERHLRLLRDYVRSAWQAGRQPGWRFAPALF